MIYDTLAFLRDQLNSHVREILGSAEDPVTLSQVVNQAGELAITSRLGLALVKVDEERSSKSQVRHRRIGGQIVYFTEPDLKLNLYVLIAAKPDSAVNGEPLRSIAAVVNYFQAHASFDSDSFPSLATAGIGQLRVFMETVNFETQNHIWGTLGAKYLPSVIYKVGVLSVQQGIVEATAKPILSTEVNTAS